ncbi:hypothetical protein [Dermatobacter hominis]|uniref:hypothetical protein n=1 Tax=Dermatobacter hominis TaxID=2884263 RepID=UPI001D0F57AC|nr:hypothetical protein [Dermatobacter hominis]UDY35106.1 hypothetical protein LH044_17415 [Dermatobacter hominis]
MSGPVVVHLLGYPGTGKLTVATELAAEGERRGRPFVVVDTTRPVLDHLDG